jgi:uncharacterized protein YjbJ (UPF0337 family)
MSEHLGRTAKWEGHGLQVHRLSCSDVIQAPMALWGNLTDDDLTAINGERDQLEGKIQERYGLAKDKVRKDVDDWYNAQTW